MFLSALSLAQKRVFLGLAKEILVIDDDRIDCSEEACLRGLCSEMSLSYNDEQKIPNGEIINIFSEIESRRIVLLELIALGYSNQEYHESQGNFASEMAEYLNIPRAELRTMENLVREHMILRDKFMAVIKGNDRSE